MNTEELDRMLCVSDATKGYYLGVYAVDQLPKEKISQDVWLLVCNCCPIDLPGEHWVAMFGNARGEIDFFDSFGFPPNAYDGVHQFLGRQETSLITYNTMQLQSMESDACGPYCLFFAYYRSLGRSMCDIVADIIDGVCKDRFISYILGMPRDEFVTFSVLNVIY